MPTDTQEKTIPKKACRWAAEVEIGNNGDNAKTAPVSIIARSGEPINHWYWGKVVHDLSGMTSKPRVPLDYCHCDDDVIGYANHFNVEAGGLRASGALVPYSTDPEDKASEVVYKSREGIPYEASIYFDGPLVIEQLDDGTSATVNGYELQGPAMIIRQWTLRGIAICPYGYDPNTSTDMNDAEELSKGRSVSATFKFTKRSEVNMSATVTSNEPTETPADEVVIAQPGDEVVTSTETATEQSAAATSELAKAPGERFLTAFGDRGGVWFAQGLSFDDAQVKFSQEQTAEVERLKIENAQLKSQLTASRGEPSPVSFSDGEQNAADNGVDSRHPDIESNHGNGVARFARGIVLPGKVAK